MSIQEYNVKIKNMAEQTVCPTSTSMIVETVICYMEAALRGPAGNLRYVMCNVKNGKTWNWMKLKYVPL